MVKSTTVDEAFQMSRLCETYDHRQTFLQISCFQRLIVNKFLQTPLFVSAPGPVTDDRTRVAGTDYFSCCVFTRPRPPRPLSATSAPSPAGCLSLSRAAPWGCWAPHTVKYPPPVPQRSPNGPPPLDTGSCRVFSSSGWITRRLWQSTKKLRSAVWSTVITSGVFNISGGGVGGGESGGWVGVTRGSARAETEAKCLHCNGIKTFCVRPVSTVFNTSCVQILTCVSVTDDDSEVKTPSF